MTTISFTASRFNFAPPPSVVASVLSARVPLADRYVTGACQGGDAWIGAWLYVTRPAAEHVVVVPCNRRQVDPWWTRTGSLPLVTVIDMPPGTNYADRNRELVARADQVFGFPAFPEEDPRSQRSGTWQTIRMARDAGKLRLWQCVTPPYRGQVEALTGEPDLAAPATVSYREELARFMTAEGEEKIRMLFAEPDEHQPWCGDASLSRPDDECTCDVTPEMQYAQRGQSEAEQARRGDDGLTDEERAEYARRFWAVANAPVSPEMRAATRRRLDSAAIGESRHQARRGDDVEAWLRGWRDLLGGDPWHAVNGLLDDYRKRADLGIALDDDSEAGHAAGHGAGEDE